MRRVVIVGTGVVSPLGIGTDSFEEKLFKGESGIDTIPEFVDMELPVTFGGKVWDWSDEDHFDRRTARRLDPFSKFAIVAAREAWKMANLKGYDPYRAGVIFATGMGGIQTLENQHQRMLDRGPRAVSAVAIPMIIPNMAAAGISMHLSLRGPSFAPTTACAASLDAIGLAYRLIKAGIIDIAVAGGTDAALTPFGISGFASARALSRRNNDPKRASRPFDKDHDGFVMSEGAAAVVLADLETAIKNDAPILAEIVGYGATSDAHHVTAPHPDGIPQAEAIKMALQEAKISPKDVDYINAHGTSTPANDKTETKVIKNAFGEYAYKVNISSTKSMTGHLLGAAGAIEVIATVLAIKRGEIPPTINFEEPDPECDLNYTPNTPVKKEITYAVKESFGFGGHNAVLVIRRWDA